MKKNSIKMLSNMVLVKVTLELEPTGIALPTHITEAKKADATTGTAYVVGPDCKYIKKDDFVFYKQYVGNILDHEELSGDPNVVYIVVSENDILGHITNGAK